MTGKHTPRNQFLHAASESMLQRNQVKAPQYKRMLFIFLALMFSIKLVLAFVLELGNDEAYYWLYSQYLQWNYFDHPPAVALWIRLFTANLALENYEGFIRLGSVVGGVLSTWFLFRAVSLLHSERAGWFAAVLYNFSFYSGITAGLYILPDSPQMVFWTLAMLLIAKITSDENNWWLWLLYGVVAGLCIMSKVHGAFLWIGMGGYVLFHRREWLKKTQLYVALLITLAIMSPIVFWNIQYDFATFRFHSNRVDMVEIVVHWRFFLKEIANQIGFNNPVVFLLALSGLVAWYRHRIRYNSAIAINLFTGLPLAFLLLFVSLFRNVTLPHWSGPAYVSLMPLAAMNLANISKRVFPISLRWGLGIFFGIYFAYAAVINFYPGNLGSQNAADMGHGDITLDMYGWREAGDQFKTIFRNDVAQKKMPANAAIVTSKWWGAHVEYYFARPFHLTMIGVGNPANLNEYLWTNQWRQKETDVNNAYCIMASDDRYTPPLNFYESSELASVIEIDRGGKPAHRFFVYRLKGLKKAVPVIKEKH